MGTAGGEQFVDEFGKFVSHGGYGFRGAQAGLQAAAECSQGAVGADDRLSTQTQNSGSSVGAGACFSSPAPCSAAGFVRAGAEAQPTAKMFDRRKRGHVSADFRDQLQCRVRADAVDRRQVHRAESVQQGPQVERRFVARFLTTAGGARAQRFGRQHARRGDALQMRFNLLIQFV